MLAQCVCGSSELLEAVCVGPNIIEKVGCELVESARNGWQLVGSPALGG